MADEMGGAEERRHFRGARFIMEAGLRLGLGSSALGVALGAFLRFARQQRSSQYDPAIVAAAALLLAGKAQGAGPRARDVINVTHRCLHPGAPPPGPGAALLLRGSVGRCELLLLRTLRFRLALPQPHRYLLQFLLAVGRWGGGRRGGGGGGVGWGRLPGVSWALLRDGAAGGLGLKYPPHKVAACVLLLAMNVCGCGAPPGAPKRWWQVLSPGLRSLEVCEILRALLAIYGADCSTGGAPLRPIAPPSRPIAPPSRPIEPISSPIEPISGPIAPPSRPIVPPSHPIAPPSGPIASTSSPIASISSPIATPSGPTAPTSSPTAPPTSSALQPPPTSRLAARRRHVVPSHQ